jgi:hypothetical protein
LSCRLLLPWSTMSVPMQLLHCDGLPVARQMKRWRAVSTQQLVGPLLTCEDACFEVSTAAPVVPADDQHEELHEKRRLTPTPRREYHVRNLRSTQAPDQRVRGGVSKHTHTELTSPRDEGPRTPITRETSPGYHVGHPRVRHTYYTTCSMRTCSEDGISCNAHGMFSVHRRVPPRAVYSRRSLLDASPSTRLVEQLQGGPRNTSRHCAPAHGSSTRSSSRPGRGTSATQRTSTPSACNTAAPCTNSAPAPGGSHHTACPRLRLPPRQVSKASSGSSKSNLILSRCLTRCRSGRTQAPVAKMGMCTHRQAGQADTAGDLKLPCMVPRHRRAYARSPREACSASRGRTR